MRYIVAAFALALNSPSLALTADASDTIYVRGQPCGSFCQNWMGISRRSVAMADDRVTHLGVTRRSSRKRPALAKVLRNEKVELRQNNPPQSSEKPPSMQTPRPRPLKAANPSESSKPNSERKKTLMGTAAVEVEQDKRQTVQNTPPEQSAEPPHIDPAPSGDYPDNLRKSAPLEQTKDRQIAEVAREPQSNELEQTKPRKQTKNIEAQSESSNEVATLSETTENPEETETREATTPSASVQSRDISSSTGSDQRVALLIARPEIETITDLNSKVVAMDNPDQPARQQVRDALSAAGVKRVDLTKSPTKAIDQLIEGNVTAAVLGMVSKTAAESFPDFAGFRVFRIPLAVY